MNRTAKIGLIGVLVVAGIFVIVPVVKRARLASRDMVSQAHLREIGKGLSSYAGKNGKYPAQAIYGKDGKPLLSWRVAVLPFLEEQALYDQFDLDEPWDSEHNQKLVAQIPKAFQSMHLGKADGKTCFLAPLGKGVFFDGAEGRSPAAFTRDTRKTVAVVEVGLDKGVIWSKPDDWEVNLDKPAENLGEPILNGYNAVFIGDAHVDKIDPNSDAATVKGMLTIGEK